MSLISCNNNSTTTVHKRHMKKNATSRKTSRTKPQQKCRGNVLKNTMKSVPPVKAPANSSSTPALSQFNVCTTYCCVEFYNNISISILIVAFIKDLLTLLGPQSRFGDKLLRIWVIYPQNGTAVLKGLRLESSSISWYYHGDADTACGR